MILKVDYNWLENNRHHANILIITEVDGISMFSVMFSIYQFMFSHITQLKEVTVL